MNNVPHLFVTILVLQIHKKANIWTQESLQLNINQYKHNIDCLETKKKWNKSIYLQTHVCTKAAAWIQQQNQKKADIFFKIKVFNLWQ